jgi:hypothetical protein
MSTITGASLSTPTSDPSVATRIVEGVVMRCKPYLEVYAPFRALGKRVRDVMKAATAAGHVFPKNNQGVNMCVSYHVKGVCNSNCRQSSDLITHSDDETARFVEWCQLGFAT